jgi:predicted nucleotidyltransferase
MTHDQRTHIKRDLAACLSQAGEVRSAVLFGSFLTDDDPSDIDVAVFVDDGHSYLPLARRLRRLVRPVAERIPLDIIPVRPGAAGSMLAEINRGEVIYER